MFGAIQKSNLFPKRPSVPSGGSTLARKVLGRAVLGGIAKSVPAIKSSVPIVGGHTDRNLEVVGSSGAAKAFECGCLVVVISLFGDVLGDKVFR